MWYFLNGFNKWARTRFSEGITVSLCLEGEAIEAFQKVYYKKERYFSLLQKFHSKALLRGGNFFYGRRNCMGEKP